MQMLGVRVAFPGPGSGEFGHVVVAVGQVEAQAHGSFHAQRVGAVVADDDAACHCWLVGEHRVVQCDAQADESVDKINA